MKYGFAATVALALALSCSMVLANEQNQMRMRAVGAMTMPGPAIDVPVMLKQANVAFRIDRIAASGDNRFALQQIAMLSEKFQQTGTDAKIVAVFNGDAGFMLLNDMSYNEVRKTMDGNPYKSMVANLLARGIEVEECGMTMMREGWSKQQLLPGVKVNPGANLRIIDLVQNNYVVLNP